MSAAAPPTKKINFCFQSYIKKTKTLKISKSFCSIVDKKAQKNTKKKKKTDYAMHFNDVATLLAAQLLSQLSLQIKKKQQKL